MKLGWCFWGSNTVIPGFPAVLGSPFLALCNAYIVISPLHDRTNIFFSWWIRTGDSCLTMLPLKSVVLIFLPALCFKTQAKPSIFWPGQSWASSWVWGTSDSEALVPPLTGDYWKKHSSVDGSSLPHLWKAAWMFPVGSTIKDWLQLKACRAKQCWWAVVTCSGSGPSGVTPAPWEQLPAVQSTTAGLGSLVETRVAVGCAAGMDAHAISGRPTISLETRKWGAGLLSQRDEDALSAARSSRKGTKLQE